LALLDRLIGLSIFGHLLHLLQDRGRLAGSAVEQPLGENPILRHAAVAVGELHRLERQHMNGAAAVDGAGLDQHLPGLAAVRAGVHAQGAADRSWHAAIEREAGDARICRRARELSIGHHGSDPQAVPRLDLDVREAAAETHDHALYAAVAHQQVRAEPDGHHRDVARQVREEIGEVSLVRRREQHLRRPADAKPRDIRQHRIGDNAPAQLRH